ncbi:hypothetical protein [Streptomyces sp. F001]|uniref:hypothetical protein n=1 Tax=Streptomyces sp. F001 TaxID=1510026 RepID=UPI001F0D555C|nr:hypothetical protein [Streptomyces sp. F001]
MKEADGWHVAFRVQTLDPAPEPHTGPEVGIDAGVTIPLPVRRKPPGPRPTRPPSGRTADRDKWLTTDEKAKLLRLERRPTPQELPQARQKTSNRLKRTYDQIASLRARAKRRAPTGSTRPPPNSPVPTVIVVEQLDIPNMVKSARHHGEPGRNVAQKSA